ncbi:transmembrane protein 143-like [Mustelus asterias]
MLCVSRVLPPAVRWPPLRSLDRFTRAALTTGREARSPGYRSLSGKAQKGSSSKSSTNRTKDPDPESSSGHVKLPKEMSADYREQFIPFDKNVLHYLLLEELSSATEQERNSLTALVEQADVEMTKHYHATLERLLALFEPINPDRDTLPDLTLEDPVQLDQEMILLDNLGPVLQQANFNKLSEETIQYALSYHDPLLKSQVTVQVENYEYMMFWALGVRLGTPPREMQEKIQSSKGWFFQGKVKAPMHRRYCKRVLMAARLKKDRLVLKSFKDIPLENLEHLLPAVKMRITFTDRTFLYFTLVAGGSALFANLTVLGFYSLKVDFLLLLLLFTMLMVHRRQRLFQLKRDQHALNHANMLYNKSTSNNGELLVTLVRRAQQEHIKELMLAHAFSLLLHQSPDTRPDHSTEMATLLTNKVSMWLRERSGLPVMFNGDRALTNLRSFERRLSER